MYTEVFGNALIELAERDRRVVAVTPAMPGGSGLMKFAARFPVRMYDVGIAEQHAATMCSAMAMAGMKPVFAVYSTFLQRAYDQVVHDIARQNANVIFAIDRAGFVGADGETHQGAYDIAYLRHVPDMTLMMPKDENELRHMLYTALLYDDGPIAIRYPRIQGTGVAMDSAFQQIRMGSWEIVADGEDAVVLAIGPMVGIAQKAAEQLQQTGVSLRVVNARFVKPLDEAMLAGFAEERLPIITLEEGARLGGFGSAVLEWYAEHEIYGMKIRPIGIPDYFVEHGSVAEQRAESGLTAESIATQVRQMLTKSAVMTDTIHSGS